MEQRTELQRLDELIAKLGGDHLGTQTAGPCRLLLEHLETARRSLLGSMSGEYSSSLKFAKESIACIPGKAARGEIKEILQGLLEAGDSDHMSSSDHIGSKGELATLEPVPLGPADV